MDGETLEPNRSYSQSMEQPAPAKDRGMNIGIYVIFYVYSIVGLQNGGAHYENGH